MTSQLFANLPTPPALAQAFTQLISTRALTAALGTDRPDQVYDAQFDEKKALLTLRAKGGTPAEAKQRAEKLLGIAQSNLQDRLTDAARANAQLCARAGANRHENGGAHSRGPPEGPARGAAQSPQHRVLLRDWRRSKVDPAIARSPSPAFTYLSLQEAQQEAALSQARARAEALQGVLNEADALRKLVGQALQVQVLAPPAEPLDPAPPRPLRDAALAGLATAALGTAVICFSSNRPKALRDPTA